MPPEGRTCIAPGQVIRNNTSLDFVHALLSPCFELRHFGTTNKLGALSRAHGLQPTMWAGQGVAMPPYVDAQPSAPPFVSCSVQRSSSCTWPLPQPAASFCVSTFLCFL